MRQRPWQHADTPAMGAPGGTRRASVTGTVRTAGEFQEGRREQLGGRLGLLLGQPWNGSIPDRFYQHFGRWYLGAGFEIPLIKEKNL